MEKNSNIVRALVVDDEPEAVRGLQSMLQLFCKNVEVVGTASSVSVAVKKIEELDPEIIFLDIELKDGMGFDVLEKTPHCNFSTIFVTAFDHYAIKAIRLNALDYLLKPIDPEELVAAVSRIRDNDNKPDYSELLRGQNDGNFTKLGVPGSKGTSYIEFAEIVRMESSNNYTFIHTTNAKPLLVSKTIKSFETLLPDDTFIRCHQRHIVNLDFIESIIRKDGTLLLMKDQSQIPVSRANKLKVEQFLSQRFRSL